MAIELARLNGGCPHCQAQTHGASRCPWAETFPVCVNSPSGRHRAERVAPSPGFNRAERCERCASGINWIATEPDYTVNGVNYAPGMIRPA
jgi:hypothetical protein